MQPGPMQAGPMPPAMSDAMMPGEPCFAGNLAIPRWQFFADFLYIRPGNTNVAYGVAADTTTLGQQAQPGVASIGFDPGFRVGFARALDECNDVVATYTHWEGEGQNSISLSQPNSIHSCPCLSQIQPSWRLLMPGFSVGGQFGVLT